MNRHACLLPLVVALAMGGGLSALAADNADNAPAARPRMLPPAERFKQIDANHDGKVTLEEFRIAREKELREMARNGGSPVQSGRASLSVEETFKRIDTNGDGYITVDEFTKYFAAMFRRASGGQNGAGTTPAK